ncbi:MAG: hypothetical protein JXR59_05305 [Desulfuromonadaceae bacterium]|nr:hypothetical protein [Desulfuromonadaceae bacterium]
MPHQQQIRTLIAREAARLIYEEGLTYGEAKRKAGKEYGPGQALSHGHYLPTNREIHTHLQELLARENPQDQRQRLVQMRRLAADYLKQLDSFAPVLTGDAVSGELTPYSTIDLYLFADDPDEVETLLNVNQIPFDVEPGDAHQSEHQHRLYIDEEDETLCCTTLPRARRHQGIKSLIDGHPLEQLTLRQLERLLDHNE